MHRFYIIIANIRNKGVKMRIRSFLRKHLVTVEAVGLLMLLFAAYIIGQRIILPLRENKVNNSNDVSGEYEKKWGNYQFEIIGSEKTEDNPWGYTAGIINMDGEGECILLTPNTELVLEDVAEDSVISLELMIHPWVAESSDGAGILVRIRDTSGNIVAEDEINIGKEESWIPVEYHIDQYSEVSSVEFLCNNGPAGDDAADWVVIKAVSDYSSTFNDEGYVKSATYFSDEWPINFWNSEMDDMEKELRQIKEDGFDSIILVIPWKEFQISTSPIEYSEYAFENLNFVMEAASKEGLDVYTRIGYTWDYYNDLNENITERFLDILRNQTVHDAWLDYAEKLYNELRAYDNFENGFLTWEDFWGCLAVCDNLDESARVEYARSLGYQEWVEKNYSLEEYNAQYMLDFNAYAEIPVPLRSEPAMEAMYNFYDNYLNELLSETQDVFPNISMEVRLDADLVTNVEGDSEYYSHTATYSCEDSDFTATMYSIPMGFENKGERVSAEEALKKTEYILGNLVSLNGGKPVYVEQFLFMDNTPQFSYNAQIKENEIGQYLESVSTVLGKYTGGYGIWTYRDYRNNMLYNSQFGLEDRGWELSGTPEFCEDEETNSAVCHLNEGSSISQDIPEVRNHFDSSNYTISFDITKCEEESEIEICFGGESRRIRIKETGTYEITFNKNSAFDFKIEVLSGDVYVDNLCLYSFVQEGHLYNEKNEELEFISCIRILNEELSYVQY